MAVQTFQAPAETLSEAIRLDHVMLQELASGGPQERDWRGIATALLVIMAICSLIALAVLILTPMSAAIDYSRTPLNLTTMSKLRPSVLNARWSGQDDIVYDNVTGGVLRLSVKQMTTDVLLDKAALVRSQRAIFVKERYPPNMFPFRFVRLF
ncbi:hypothetical protein COOONC_11637 [Cooperia oncophora]